MFIIGSIQKLGENGQYTCRSEIKDYIGSSKAFFVGDQHEWSCINVARFESSSAKSKIMV
jgi:hypothetical protein